LLYNVGNYLPDYNSQDYHGNFHTTKAIKTFNLKIQFSIQQSNTSVLQFTMYEGVSKSSETGPID